MTELSAYSWSIEFGYMLCDHYIKRSNYVLQTLSGWFSTTLQLYEQLRGFSSYFFSGTILIFKGGVLCFILYSFFRASHLILCLHLEVTLLVECRMEIEYNCGKGFSEPYPRERAKQKRMMNKPSQINPLEQNIAEYIYIFFVLCFHEVIWLW